MTTPAEDNSLRDALLAAHEPESLFKLFRSLDDEARATARELIKTLFDEGTAITVRHLRADIPRQLERCANTLMTAEAIITPWACVLWKEAPPGLMGMHRTFSKNLEREDEFVFVPELAQPMLAGMWLGEGSNDQPNDSYHTRDHCDAVLQWAGEGGLVGLRDSLLALAERYRDPDTPEPTEVITSPWEWSPSRLNQVDIVTQQLFIHKVIELRDLVRDLSDEQLATLATQHPKWRDQALERAGRVEVDISFFDAAKKFWGKRAAEERLRRLFTISKDEFAETYESFIGRRSMNALATLLEKLGLSYHSSFMRGVSHSSRGRR